MTTTNSADLWVGGYTDDSDGSATGIGSIRTGADEILSWRGTAAETDSPSFLATHPTLPVVYAAQEAAQTVQAFSVTDSGDLAPLGPPVEAGASVCHVAVDPGGRFAIAACWGDGRVVTYDLAEDGSIAGRQQAIAAEDPHGGAAVEPRQSRAHATLFLADGRLLTTDLGFDLVRVWRWEQGAGLVSDSEVVLPFGSGPRHLALHPSGHVFIVTEYSIEVVVLEETADGIGVAQVAPVFADGAHDGDAAAHITIDESGARVHVTVRGANRVAVLAVSDDGAGLSPLADVDCGGDWPRHHLQRGPLLHVANQLGSTVTTFRLDEDGVPDTLAQTLVVPSPTCLVPVA